MELGLSTLLFPSGTPESALELASRLELEWVEIILDMPHLPLNPDPEELRKLGRSIESLGLSARAHGRFWDLNPISLYPEVRDISLEQTIKSIEACALIGGDMVTIHPGRCWFRGDEDIFQKCEGWFREYLEDASGFARDRGIGIAVETGSHSSEYPGNTEELLQVARCREEVGITLDVGHVFLSVGNRGGSAEEKISNMIETLGGQLVNVHLHDNRGLSDDHLPPNHGSINFHKIIEKLEEFYEGPLILELWDPSNPVETAIEGVNQLRKFMS